MSEEKIETDGEYERLKITALQQTVTWLEREVERAKAETARSERRRLATALIARRLGDCNGSEIDAVAAEILDFLGLVYPETKL